MRKEVERIKKITVRPWIWLKTLTFKKKIITFLIAIIALIVVGQVITNLTKPAPYTTQKAATSNIVETVTESGKIITSGRTDVYSPSNGVIIETYITNSMTVEEGDQLFKVKSSATDQEASAAYANYLAAVATLNAAQSSASTLRAGMYTEWKTFRDLATNSTYEKGDDTPNVENRLAAEFQIAQDEWLAAEKKYKDQVTAIGQAQALSSSTWSLYQATQDATVTAPVSGKILNLSVSEGSTIGIKSISITGSVAKPALIISTDSNNEILVELSETDIAKVQFGQKVIVNVNAVPNKEYKGIVDRVDSVGTDNNGIVTYYTYIKLIDGDEKIRQGMTVDVDITTKELKNVLSVPSSAVKPYQGGKAVRVPDMKAKDKYRFVPVIVGVRGTARTQIIKGLTEGQEIITTVSNENVKRPGLFGS